MIWRKERITYDEKSDINSDEVSGHIGQACSTNVYLRRPPDITCDDDDMVMIW